MTSMKKIIPLLLACICFLSCKQEPAESKQPISNSLYISISDSVSYRYIGTYDTVRMKSILNGELDAFLNGASMPSSEFKSDFSVPKFGMKLYRVKYKSVVPEWNNKSTVSTGLLAIPDNGLDSFPMISYQHGTVFEKTSVPSIPDSSMETRLMLAQYGSQGFIVIGADYHGLGESEEPNSFFAKQSTEQAMVDMYKASEQILQHLKIKQGPFFIHGWSQGGFNTMCFLRKLETLKIPVRGCITAAGPAEMSGIINRWINNVQPQDAAFLPGAATNFFFVKEKYDGIEGITKAAIQPQYYELAKSLYEFRISFMEFFQKTNYAKIDDVLNEEFRKTGNLAISPLWKKLEEMQAYRWRPTTPIMNYCGQGDEVVPYEMALAGPIFQNVLGVKTTAYENAGEKADHRCTYVYSLIHSKPIYDSLLHKN